MDISELDLSCSDFNAVKRSGINTTDELIERLPEFCLTARKTGAKVMEALHERGLLPFHLGEWVEPDRCGETLRPEELHEGEFVIFGFPTESRDWRKVVLIEKIDGETVHYRDGSSGLPHTPIGARKVWRIAGECGQAPSQTELEALGVPEVDCKLLARYGCTSVADMTQNLQSHCRAVPSAVKSVYRALHKAGRVPFVPGDEPEDTDLIGEELSYSDLQSMPGELIVYADSEYDAPFIALITRVTDGSVWIWGDLIHPYSVTESEFTEDCKAFRIKINNTPQSGIEKSEGICMNEEKNAVVVSENYTKAVTLTSSIRSKAETANALLFSACQELKIVHDEELYKELGYKNFDDYCETETGFTRQYVLDHIKICELGEDFVNSSLHLGKKKLIMLAKLDEPTREAVTETVDVESVTVKELQAQIKTLTAERDTANASLESKDRQFQAAMESKDKQIEAVKESGEKSLMDCKKFLNGKIHELEAQIQELENQPVEHDITDSDTAEELKRLKRELEDEQLKSMMLEKSAEAKARKAADDVRHELTQMHETELQTLREGYEKQLSEEAKKPDRSALDRAKFYALKNVFEEIVDELETFLDELHDDPRIRYVNELDNYLTDNLLYLKREGEGAGA